MSLHRLKTRRVQEVLGCKVYFAAVSLSTLEQANLQQAIRGPIRYTYYGNYTVMRCTNQTQPALLGPNGSVNAYGFFYFGLEHYGLMDLIPTITLYSLIKLHKRSSVRTKPLIVLLCGGRKRFGNAIFKSCMPYSRLF